MDRSIVLAGRGRTNWWHQKQSPRNAATEGVMKAPTTNVANNKPQPKVVPNLAMLRRSLTNIEAMV
ncbi:hypothetical protein AN933_25180, partial [Mycobacterium intracellulare subsp. chimaera]